MSSPVGDTQDEEEGERATQLAIQKLSQPTLPMPESLAAASLNPNPTMPAPRAFTPGVAIDSCFKLRILEGLFVPFDVLYAAEQGWSIE